jgi:hypothetical protein
MITDLIDVEPLLGQHDPGMVLVGPLLSLSINSSYRYFYIAGKGSKVYETISLGFVELETTAQTQHADFIKKLETRFAQVLTFGSHLEMARAVHTRWPNEETAKFLAFAELDTKLKPTKMAGQQESIDDSSYGEVVPGDYRKQPVGEMVPERVNHGKDIDAISRHAPPSALDQAQPMPVSRPAQTLAPSSPPIATLRQPLGGDHAVTEPQWHSGLSQDDIASAILRLKSPAKLGGVPRLPVEGARSLTSILLRFCAVGCAVALVAALVAWTIVRPGTWQVANEAAPTTVLAPSISVSSNKNPSQAAAAVPASSPSRPAAANEPALQAKPAEADEAVQAEPTPAGVPPSPPSQPSQVASVHDGTAPVSAPQSPPAQEASTARRLDAEEIATLVNRGTDFMTSGDLASARLLLRRAAEAGSASAALMLGTTFDPLVIQQLGAVGVVPDVTQARQWYKKAAALGSDAASQRLAKLPQTGQ